MLLELPHFLLLYINTSPPSSWIKDYGPILGALTGSTISILYTYLSSKRLKEKEIIEKKKKVAKALFSEMNYLGNSIRDTFDTTDAYYNKKINHKVTQEDITKFKDDDQLLLGIIKFLKGIFFIPFNGSNLLNNINVDLFVFNLEECQMITDFYYNYGEIYTHLFNLVKNQSEDKILDNNQRIRIKAIIELYLEKMQEIMTEIEPIKVMINKHIDKDPINPNA